MSCARYLLGVRELVWPVILRLPVEPRTIGLITSPIDLELMAEELASEGRFLAPQAC
jgi:hypothetical protein